MKYKAIFFDRDNTLTYFIKKKKEWHNRIIREWSENTFELFYEKMINLFDLSNDSKTIDEKQKFFEQFKYMLIEEGVKEDIDNSAALLFNEIRCSEDRALFPETVEVLEYFHSRGYKIGVISNTTSSLEYTLQQLDIAKYFTSFTASSLVGAEKPSPIIFNAALNAQGVSAEESIYVDDYKPEADGARELGFTSFLLDRTDSINDKWSIQNLRQLIDFVEKS